MRRCIYWVFLALASCAAACTDGDVWIEGDVCPDDPDKIKPGKCGCGVPDVDLNGDGVIDCLENEDKCPDDPDKTEPGKCGCGVPDIDANENGILDCFESGAVDYCPTDPDKWDPGKCGCGVPDTASNTADSDGDGTIDCLDKCPDNPKKTIPDIYGCDNAPDDLDSDGDGVPDNRDACPHNPDISVEISDEYVDCNPGNEPVIELTKAEDFEALRDTLDALAGNQSEGLACSGGPVCLDEQTILECHNGVWRSRDCASCTSDSCSQPAASLNTPTRLYTVRVMNDINLADNYETTVSENGCTLQWQSIPQMNNIRFEAIQGAVIRAELADGTRCALPQALIHEADLTEFKDLVLDFDMTASAQAALVDLANSSTLEHVVYKGTMKTEAVKDVGGIVGYASASHTDIEMLFKDSYCDKAIIKAPKACNVGCIAGRMVDSTVSTGPYTNHVASLSALENAGGLVGMMSSETKVSKIENAKNQVTLMDCTQYCGGALGICDGSGSISAVENKLETMNAPKGEYVGGFAGGIYLLNDAKSVHLTDVNSSSDVLNVAGGYYSAGFVAYTSGNVTYQNIQNNVTQLIGDFYTGGFSASAIHVNISDVDNIVAELKAQNASARSAYTGGFTAEAVGGTYTRIISRVVSLINNSSTSGSIESEYQHCVGGFVGSVSESVRFEHISSWANIYSNFITPAGFLGRLEASWTTETPSQATLNDIVSMSRLYKFTNGSNILGSSTEYEKNLMAGTLSDYSANHAYFYKRDSGTAFASNNGQFEAMTDSNKSEVLASLQSSWNGWQAQTVSLGAETIGNVPSFE